MSSSPGDPPIKNPINYDYLVNADRDRVARRTVLLFDRLQLMERKEENVLALAAAFILLCERLKVNIQDAFTATRNLMVDRMRHQDGHRDARFAAIADHLREDYE